MSGRMAPKAAAPAEQQFVEGELHNSRTGQAAVGVGGSCVAAAPPPLALQPWPSRHTAAYQACYCEENVYLLARDLLAHPRLSPRAELYVVFVSNASKTVPLWRQRAAPCHDTPVVWDYHVFLVLRQGGGHSALVFDVDCTLDSFPCALGKYAHHALLGSCGGLPRQYQRCYRVIPAPAFLAHFSSDRSHMRGEGGEWLQPPPGWPPIIGHAAAAAAAEAAANSDSSRNGSVLANTLPAYLSFPPWEQLAQTDNLAARHSGIDSFAEPQQRQQQQEQQQPHQKQQQQEPAWLGTVMEEQAFLHMFGVG